MRPKPESPAMRTPAIWDSARGGSAMSCCGNMTTSVRDATGNSRLQGAVES